MAAELDAIDLASKILQFLDLGIRLFSTAKEIHKSQLGLDSEDEELLEVTKSLQVLARFIHEGNSTLEDQLIEVNLYKIARSCDRLATDLIDILSRLGVNAGRNSRWESFRRALYKEHSKSKVEDKQKKLERLRQNLILHLTVASSNQQSVTLNLVRILKTENAKLNANTTTRLEAIQSHLENAEALDGNIVSNIVSQLEQITDEARKVQKQQQILSTLIFPKIKQRYISIQEHHTATFDWIFASKTTSFCEWLESGDGIFWVKGKAGSGKSTLMKFLASHPGTQARLDAWGSSKRVIIASHFFWNAGSSIQKSLMGLWQTLMYQILKECPELIEVIFASRWAKDGLTATEPWDDEELLLAFNELSRQSSMPFKFCFFIDGLDEYTAGEKRYQGTFNELVKPLQALASSDSIKICVSSRPWNAFNDSFGQLIWQVQLEDVTKNDIRKYVTEELDENPHFKSLVGRDSRCTEIPDTIVKRAQGVFLWVYLVVLSLKRGLSNEDNYADLIQRLNELPDDLEEYFKHILQSIEPVYWDQTTRILRIVMSAEQSLPLLGFEFLDQEMTNPEYSITMRGQEGMSEDLDKISPRLKKRLNARCRDLLYVAENAEESGPLKFQVDFLHRTVRDFFLDTGVMDDMLRERATRKFNPHLSLCKIMLCLSKILVVDPTNSQVYNHIFVFADSLMYYVQQIEESCPDIGKSGHLEFPGNLIEAFKILDELERSNSARMSHLGFHWTNLKDPPKGMFQEYRQKTFLASTIQARLSLYVAESLCRNKSQLREKRGRPLLDYALRPTMVTPFKVPGLNQGPALGIVKLLLELGSDPNQSIYIYDGKTTWELFLRACYQQAGSGFDSDSTVEDIGTAIQLMISHGARTTLSIKLEDGTPLEIVDIVEKVGLPGHQIGVIKELLEQKQNSGSILSWIISWVS